MPSREDVENATLILDEIVERHSDKLTAGCVKVLQAHFGWLLLSSAIQPGIIRSGDERNVVPEKEERDV